MSAHVFVRRFSSAIALAVCAVASRQAYGQQQPVPVPREAAKSRSTPYKDPNLATALSVLIPGGGQLYAGRWGKGLAVLGGTAAGIGIAIDANQSSRCDGGGPCNVHGVQTVAIVGAVAVWGYGWLTAGQDARRKNAQMLNGTSIAPFLNEHNGRMVAGLSLKTR
jgi:hypothetical protein